MINLPQVTLYGCCWSGDTGVLSRTERVLRWCESFARFGNIELFRPTNVHSIHDFNQWIVHEVPNLINTSFAMHVHDDGFPTNPELWANDFLRYDYIGAPWGDGVVGNEGFSIQSKRLLKLKTKLPPCNEPSDNFVCRTWRKWLELKGMRFAEANVALRFSTEGQLGDNFPSFGFHGRHATPAKFQQGWSKISQFESNA